MIITFVDSNGNEINYNAHYKLPSAAFEERIETELFADDNFMVDDIDTILETDNLINVDYKFSTDIDFHNDNNTMTQLPIKKHQITITPLHRLGVFGLRVFFQKKSTCKLSKSQI